MERLNLVAARIVPVVKGAIRPIQREEAKRDNKIANIGRLFGL
jgi:hypothetical protein